MKEDVEKKKMRNGKTCLSIRDKRPSTWHVEAAAEKEAPSQSIGEDSSICRCLITAYSWTGAQADRSPLRFAFEVFCCLRSFIPFVLFVDSFEFSGGADVFFREDGSPLKCFSVVYFKHFEPFGY
ncbi:hypothetical protein CDAR_597331 [Caerostris darwini]|uniref:Uncharacterized protein n=1 Tax=Caerostris darwini TaxID=1538125 RepID=A0AAV4U2G1_9ARAC|nr:hypothetical protein CDAR_597331 [Caerostris darwini]